jgi:uncharacterized protein YjbJ (UPF0337 family)
MIVAGEWPPRHEREWDQWSMTFARLAQATMRYRREEFDMASGKSDEVKGRVKEATGVLTGDKKLEREGKADQSAGKVKQVVEKVKKKAEKAIDEVKDAFN